MTLGSHQRSIGKSQDRITPRSILDPLLPFDTDPAAASPRPWPCARRSITLRQNSLAMEWRGFGRVWLNPPFDRRVIGDFVARMCGHNHGTLLVHVRTETEWFRPIWESAAAILFLAGRVIFHNQDGSLASVSDPHSKHYGKVANSGAPVALCAFGRRDADILASCGLDGKFVPLILPRGVLIRALDRSTWRAMVEDVLARHGEVTLDELYRALKDHPKARGNRNWKPKIRQTLQRARFRRVGRGRWTR